jgi:hypothetical protein
MSTSCLAKTTQSISSAGTNGIRLVFFLYQITVSLRRDFEMATQDGHSSSSMTNLDKLFLEELYPASKTVCHCDIAVTVYEDDLDTRLFCCLNAFFRP